VRLVAIFELCQQTWVRLISVFNPGAVLANQTSVLANQTSLLNEGYSYIIPVLKLNYKSVLNKCIIQHTIRDGHACIFKLDVFRM